MHERIVNILRAHAIDPWSDDAAYDAINNEACYEALFEYYFCEAQQMPYGTAKARTGDPYEWMDEHLRQDLAEAYDAEPRPCFACGQLAGQFGCGCDAVNEDREEYHSQFKE